jgi:hypothetical protein
VNVTRNYFANRPQYADRWRDGRWAHSPEQHRSVDYGSNGAQWARTGNAAVQPPNRVHDPLPMQQQIARPAQPQPPVARTMPQPERPMARPVQQPQQGAWRVPQQSMYAGAHPTPRLPETIARPLPQQPSRQTMMRQFPQPSQTYARSMPQPRQIANPVMMQRSAPQVAYNPQPRAQIQMAANHGQERDAGRGAPNREPTNSRAAQERDHR